MKYRNTLSSNHSFGDIIRKFDAIWTVLIDSVGLSSSTPKIGIFHDVLQMFSRGQNYEFCHTESRS